MNKGLPRSGPKKGLGICPGKDPRRLQSKAMRNAQLSIWRSSFTFGSFVFARSSPVLGTGSRELWNSFGKNPKRHLKRQGGRLARLETLPHPGRMACTGAFFPIHSPFQPSNNKIPILECSSGVPKRQATLNKPGCWRRLLCAAGPEAKSGV